MTHLRKTMFRGSTRAGDIELLDDCARAMAGMPGETRDAAQRVLVEVLSSRHEYWREVAKRRQSTSGSPVLLAFAILSLALFPFSCLSAVILDIYGLLLAGACTLVSITLWIVYFNTPSNGRGRRSRVIAVNPHCRHCKFDLRGLRPAVSPDELEGLMIGPDRCPECGDAWPQIPPPIP